MKITKETLKKIIKEEIDKVILEVHINDWIAKNWPEGPSGREKDILRDIFTSRRADQGSMLGLGLGDFRWYKGASQNPSLVKTGAKADFELLDRAGLFDEFRNEPEPFEPKQKQKQRQLTRDEYEEWKRTGEYSD